MLGVALLWAAGVEVAHAETATAEGATNIVTVHFCSRENAPIFTVAFNVL